MNLEPIDVEFSEVGKVEGPAWYETPYLFEDVLRLIYGTALWAFAGYCFHTWLANNF